MKYRIIGTTVPAVEFRLEAGESLYTQRGGLAWETSGINMETNVNGGLMKGLGRLFAGESLFMVTYSAEKSNAEIAFSSTVPGSIVMIDVEKTPYTVQKGAFLVAQSSVDINTVFNKRLGTGFFGGEGFIMQNVSGRGLCFLEVDGDVVNKELAPGEVLKVDTGNVVAFEDTVKYDIETIKGFGNMLFGGEGLFLARLTGPGKVILQTQNFSDFAGRIIKLIPPSNK